MPASGHTFGLTKTSKLFATLLRFQETMAQIK